MPTIVTSDNQLWLVPLTVLATAYVNVPEDTDEATVVEIARDAVVLHAQSFGVTIDLDSTLVGEPVESVVQGETLAETVDDDGKEVEAALRTGGWDK